MSFGVPLVVANTPVFNEVYDNAALYFDANNPESIADNLSLLANDTKFHAEQQQKSLDRGAMFSWDQTAKETYKIYEKIIQNNES
jgi:glycosyltransferase involved in cell wall biosynthesis